MYSSENIAHPDRCNKRTTSGQDIDEPHQHIK